MIQRDDRNSHSPSDGHNDATPSAHQRELPTGPSREVTPSARPIKDHHYISFVPSRHETWAPIRPFPPSGIDGTIPSPLVGMLAPSFGSSNPLADDLAHYLTPLQHQTIRNYIPGDGRPGSGGPPDGGIGGPGPLGGGPPGLPGGLWHGHGGPMILAGLTDRPMKYSGKAHENAEF